MKHSANQRNEQVLAYLDLVTPIAWHYSRASGQDHDDLTQVGRLGLLKAAQQFNTGGENTFRGYAKAHIRGAILHYLRDNAGLVRLPRTLQEQAQRMIREHSSNAPSRSNLTAQDSLVVNTYRYQAQWSDYDEQVHYQQQHERSGMQRLTDNERKSALATCWKALPRQERDCLQAVVVEGTSLRTTAERLGTSAMTVQRRVKRGLRRLAGDCRQKGLRP